jgi:Tfp pilus assembly protein PilF/mono/diheme cytochrome c family protein
MFSFERLTIACGVLVACVGASIWGTPAVRAADRPVTFTRDVAPIVFAHCAGCHRPGEAAPFSLFTYQDVKSHARLIAAVTQARYMPPWQPDSTPGVLEGDRRLDAAQIDILRRWMEEGTVEGDASDLPPVPTFTSAWRLGPPDLVVSMPAAFTVPASGKDVFRNFVLPVPLTERKYVRAMEFRPGNARVLHHARILLDDTGETRRVDARDAEAGFPGMDVPGAHFPDGHFLGWAPGKRAAEEAFPWPIEPGTDLIVQMHLKPSGREESVQASVGLYLTDVPPPATPVMVRLGSKTIDIPSGDAGYEVADRYVLPADVRVTSIYPHAHYLAKDMRVTARRPDGRVETLLHIPDWNFNWQDEYVYRQPWLLEKGTTVVMRYTYDNSAGNAHNPNQPPRRVRFGPETTDEMGELLLQVLPRNVDELGTIRTSVARKNLMTDLAGEEKRIRDEPTDYETRNALGVVYMQVGREPDALTQFDEALRIAPDYPLAHYNLAVIAMHEGRIDEAVAHFRQALAARPDYAEALNNLGVLYESTGRVDEAFVQYLAAIAARPSHAGAHNNLGRVLLARGQVDEAAAHFEAALRTSPENGDALYNLGRARLAAGAPRDAVQYWHRALVAKPDSVTILADFAWLLASEPAVRNVPEAIALAERANGLAAGANPVVLNVLAATYAADGRFDLAARVGQQALERALASHDETLAEDIRRRLNMYQHPDRHPEIP